MIFVFGSNEAGVHGAGAARYALNSQGAIYGKGVGMAGNSYALPTKDRQIRTLPLSKVKGYVDDFINFATANPHLEFKVTRIGCGLAGFRDVQIAPLFTNAPSNCLFDSAWSEHLSAPRKYWGTM